MLVLVCSSYELMVLLALTALIQCVELNGEDLSCYSNKTESVSLRKCPYDH